MKIHPDRKADDQESADPGHYEGERGRLVILGVPITKRIHDLELAAGASSDQAPKAAKSRRSNSTVALLCGLHFNECKSWHRRSTG